MGIYLCLIDIESGDLQIHIIVFVMGGHHKINYFFRKVLGISEKDHPLMILDCKK